MPNAETINYTPRRAALPDKPREVSVSITRTADNLWHTSMPVEDLDYLIAVEFESQRRQRQLRDIADHNDEDSAEIARHSLFIEGDGCVPSPKIFPNQKSKLKTKPRKTKP
jgi:hypothetical protein